jgi:hypothetical protein
MMKRIISYMSLNSFGLSSLFILGTLLFSSCNSAEIEATGNSAITVLGNNDRVSFVDFIPTKDGGFVLGAGTWKKGNPDFWILKFDKDLNIVWESTVGGEGDEHLSKLYVDEEGNILAGGTTDSYDQDTLPDDYERRELLFFSLLNSKGDVQWNKTHIWEYVPGWNYVDYSFQGQWVYDINKDKNGDFIIACDVGRNAYTPELNMSVRGCILKLNEQGEMLYNFADERPGIRAVYEDSDNYYAAFSPFGNTNFKSYSKSLEGGYNNHDTAVEGFNSVFGFYIDEVKGKSSFPEFSFTKLSISSALTSSYDASKAQLKEDLVEFDNKAVSLLYNDNTYTLTFENGLLQTRNAEFELQKEMKLNYKIARFIQLTDGTFVGVLEIYDAIYLVHFNDKSEILK